MKRGMEATFQVLTLAPGETADGLLIRALESPNRAVQEGALNALLSRRSSRGPAELVSRWTSISSRWRSLIARRPGRCSTAIREAIMSDDASRCESACVAGRALCDYELVVPLVQAIENREHPQRDLLVDTLMGLIESLYDELASRRDYRVRRDPHQVRHHVLVTLEQSLTRYSQHRSTELVEAFLILVNRDHVGLKRILAAPNDPVYHEMVDRLCRSPRPGIMRLALSFLDDPKPPRGPLLAVIRRHDTPFVRHLLRKIGDDFEPAFQANLKRINSIPWLQNPKETFSAYSEQEHALIVKLATSISLEREPLLDVLGRMLTRGKVPGRVAAAAALAALRGSDVNELVFAGLEDPEPTVRAPLLMQLREKGIPGAIDRLLDELDSQHPVIRAAIQQSMPDFSFPRYMSAFDKLDEEVQISTGLMVAKIDPNAITGLEQELASEVRTRRLRAVEMTLAMSCQNRVEPALRRLLGDPDHFIRMYGIQAIARCTSSAAREALTRMLDDDHPSVREAARSAIEENSHDERYAGDGTEAVDATVAAQAFQAAALGGQARV